MLGDLMNKMGGAQGDGLKQFVEKIINDETFRQELLKHWQEKRLPTPDELVGLASKVGININPAEIVAGIAPGGILAQHQDKINEVMQKLFAGGK
jgi:hypothetical protein